MSDASQVLTTTQDGVLTVTLNQPARFNALSGAMLHELAAGMEIVAEGWRTGPAATMLVFTLEFAKAISLPVRTLRQLHP